MARLKLNYFAIPLFVFLVSFFGGWLTEQGMEWYKTIALPDFTPQGYIIGIVWTAIFILSAISALIVWNKKRHVNFQVVVFVFIVNALINVGWSYLFFYSGLIASAFFTAIALEISVLVLIGLIWNTSRIASLLLLPYALWVVFASYLNYSIWLLNK